MRAIGTAGIALIVLAIIILLSLSLYVVGETEQAVITQFGKPVGDPVSEPGLHFKLFYQKANRFEKRFLEWDGDPNQLPTKDKRFIFVDTYARWRISDPLLYFTRLRDELGAQSRLDDILDGETRNTIAKHNLIDVVRSSNRELVVGDEVGGTAEEEEQERVDSGRSELTAEVLAASQTRVGDLGIEILDFRFKRINYVQEVQREVYARMISERQRIAEQFRSEGAGESARINGERERELRTINSEAYKEAKEIKGKADAQAADIYAAAYNRDPEFYRFLKTMEVYRQTLGGDTILMLGTDGEFLRYLEKSK